MSKKAQINQLVFIDDSGDPGFKIEKGSSKTFVIACIIFDDYLEAEKAAVVIKELRRSLKFPETTEFRFNKSSKKTRLAFLNEVSKYKFRTRAIVMEKSIIRSGELKRKKETFYQFAIKMVLKHNFGTIKNARVKLDGHGERIFRRKMTTYLRKELNTAERKIIDNLKFVDSRNNVLIQLADIVAGSINRSFDKTKTDHKLYLNILKRNKRIEDVWEFK
ncbi:MAG: DUF3800 domain-containing protein [Candidatus Aenigmarchaeota archaeon]|nr:DUF3800 domain-containing protein [Candidatus Aenigmarchaeota archaeon]